MVLAKNRRTATNVIFFILVASLISWTLFTFLSTFGSSNALFMMRATMLSVVLENTSFYYLTKVFPNKKIVFTKRVKLELAYSLVVMIVSLSPLLFVDVAVGGDGTLSPIPGPGMILFLGHVLWFVAGGLWSLVKRYIAKSGLEKSQLRSLLIGGSILYLLIPLSNFVLPIVFKISNLVALSSIYTTLFAVIIGYSIIRQRLFDVRLAIVRTLTYLLSLGALGASYYFLAFALSNIFTNNGSDVVGQNPLNIALALVLAFFFQPVKKFFDKITNRIFYKDNYNTDDFFEKLNKVLGFTTDLRGLLERTATEIGKTLKGEQAFFYINTDDGHYVTAGTPKHKQLPQSDAEQLNKVEKTKNGVIIASLLEDDDSIKRLMLSHRIELILPLLQDDKIIGYLCLGDHLTSSYTNRDIKVLNTISNELIIAIQNALAVQEIREFNITLQQRIANATRELRSSNAQLRHLDKAKDEFLSMASHQLRTPLTSVKGYISMVLEGDAGKVSSDQKKLLSEAFMNSEHMVGLINDFLNVSRIQTGKFMIEKVPTDLSQVIQQELESLKPSATSRKLSFNYEPPTNFPLLNVDEGKIRQVIMNFADNSLYYSKEDTKINISLSVQGDEAVFTVKDTGIGVPASEQDELFSKFYRASNAKKKRPDGTGVGLFLAKKIVDGHGGKIIFESVEGKGSTFGFSLPIEKLNLVASCDTNNLDNQNNN